MRALREDNLRLEARLRRLEDSQQLTAAPRPAPAVRAPSPAAPPTAEVAAGLTVVKLKPKKEAAPRLPTAVPVQEPPEELAVEFTNLTPSGAASVAALSAGEADPKLGEALFTFGFDKLKTGNIQGGVEELTRFAEENPRHARADNALYFVAVGQMSLDDLPAAALTLEKVLSRYPAGDAVLDANLKLAEVRARMKRPGEARALYEKILSDFPGTAAASTAQARLNSLADARPNR